LLTAFGSAGERQAASDFPVPTLALPRNVTFSLTTRRGASMSPRKQDCGGVVPRLGLAVSLLGRPLQHRQQSDYVAVFGKMIIPGSLKKGRLDNGYVSALDRDG